MTKNFRNRKRKNIQPQPLAKWVFRYISRSRSGDIEEEYCYLRQEKGHVKAMVWFWFQIIISVPSFIKIHTCGSLSMLKSYVKIALRSLNRHKAYSFINIFGLSLGVSLSLTVFMYARYEFSYDTFHKNADSIYRVIEKRENPYRGDRIGGHTPYSLGDALGEAFPEVVNVVRLHNVNGLIKIGENAVNKSFYYVSPTFFDMFSFPLIQGDKQSPLQELNSIVITRKFAESHFKGLDPVGRQIRVQRGRMDEDFIVTAVVENTPQNSSIVFDFVIPFEKVKANSDNDDLSGWASTFSETHIQLTDGGDVAAFEKKLDTLSELYKEDLPNTKVQLSLQKLTDIRLDSSFPETDFPVGNPFYINVAVVLSIIVLFIACSNFVTLSTGRSLSRAKEVGVRKVVGALKMQLLQQYLGEAVLMSFFSVVLGVVIAFLILPTFNEFYGKELSFSLDLASSAFLMGVFVLVGIISGSYPALVLTRFNPVSVLKGGTALKTKSAVSSGLIVLQFSMSIFLIFATLIVTDQLNFIKEKELGYDKERLLTIALNVKPGEGTGLFDRFKNELQHRPNIVAVSAASDRFNTFWTKLGFEDEEGVLRRFIFHLIDVDYVHTMGFELIAGENFSRELSAYKNKGIIVNETLVEQFGLKSPANAIGKKIHAKFANQEIIGVIRDFNFKSLHKTIEPLAIGLSANPVLGTKGVINFVATNNWPLSIHHAVIRVGQGALSPIVDSIRDTWKSVAPGKPFTFRFLEDNVQDIYFEEQQWGKLVNFASIFAIVIACLGLFGLASTIVEKRFKEIGVRKVLGASFSRITALLSGGLLSLVLWANVIAWPVAYYSLDRWLQNFAYRTTIDISVFVISGFLAVLVAFLAISFQVIRAATANPVKVLRSE